MGVVTFAELVDALLEPHAHLTERLAHSFGHGAIAVQHRLKLGDTFTQGGELFGGSHQRNRSTTRCQPR